MKNKVVVILIFTCVLLLLVAIIGLKNNYSVNYLFYMNSLISFYVFFFIFKWGFICFWLVVVLYNIYKSKLKVNLPMSKLKIYVYDSFDKLRKKDFWKSFSKSKQVNNTIRNALIRYIYKVFIYSILGIIFPAVSLWFYILLNIAITGSYRYIISTIDVLSNPSKDKKDFSLTSSYMRKAFTLHKLILLIFIIILGYYVRYIFL